MSIIILFVCLMGIINPSNAEKKNTATALESAVKKLALNDVQAQMTLEITDAGGNNILRKLNVSFARFEGTRKVMIEITGPEDLQGTRILTTHFSNNSQKSTIEVYLPSTGKIKKFRANNHCLKIPGCEIPMNHFSSSAFDGYIISEEEKDTLNGREVQKIKLQLPGNPGCMVVYLDVRAELLYQVRSYDSNGILTSNTEFTDYRHPGSFEKGTYFPYKMNVYNPVSGQRSNLTIKKLNHLIQIRDSDFELANKSNAEK
ncbi:outer membrane lipoprotein-sorting protein [Geofilum sp. OHC36d9]|uniref:outer membrane lipoprotein-sorting protein n=1 Tax=Geofilum sp. OHC36d9 TaxID=3458413 RepID=UPI004034C22C